MPRSIYAIISAKAFSFQEDSSGIIVSGNRELSENDIVFSDEIIEIDERLNFYMDASFPMDEVFGTHVETAESGDWINVYANYDIGREQVCDTLDIILNQADGACKELTYQLSKREKAFLLKKMRSYCMERERITLEEYGLRIRNDGETIPDQTAQKM